MASLSGSVVAIVTPMHEDGSLDLDAFRKLIDWHIADGTDGIVVVVRVIASPFRNDGADPRLRAASLSGA